MAFLYDTLLQEFGKRAIAQVAVPNHITDNLKPGFGQRPYQIEAFQRFTICDSEDFEGKPKRPFHLLYNMATGSGKTLIMAGLILHLYQKGYRNLLFFVNSNNIIQKTKDNEPIHKIFKDKEIKVHKDSKRADGQEAVVVNEPWYVYNANYGTSEDKKFVELFARKFEGLNQKFEKIYLIRNEREL